MANKLNIALLLLCIACALGVVTSQHKARKLFVELQKEKDHAQQMEVEWGQLQLEQSTWAMHARIEKIATAHLQMQVPDSSRIQVVQPLPEKGGGASGAQGMQPAANAPQGGSDFLRPAGRERSYAAGRRHEVLKLGTAVEEAA